MLNRLSQYLSAVEQTGNLRSIPLEPIDGLIDLTSNDYLGIANDRNLFFEFYNQCDAQKIFMSSVASRLLSDKQSDFVNLENTLSDLFHKSCLLFNSGYHANTGILPALANKQTLILADKFVHASIIDGIKLSGAEFNRFKHNDLEHLITLLNKYANKYEQVIVVVESIYSMDGDLCDLKQLVEIKSKYKNIVLYVDEAHGFGVRGKKGLGLCEELNVIDDIDIIVGTLGKAIASFGAFVIVSETIKKFLINCSRSFIFSTAIPPISCKWSQFVIEKMTTMTAERVNLIKVSEYLNSAFEKYNGNIRSQSQIVPLIVGDSAKAVALSQQLKKLGYQALPIRKPTVPEGTERIRFSLNAKIDMNLAEKLLLDLKTIL